MPEYIQLEPVAREIEFPDDVKRLRAALRSKGYDASDQHIQWAWEQHSECYWSAGWMTLSGLSDEGFHETLLQYLQPVEGDPE